jgi:hypothetical protein
MKKTEKSANGTSFHDVIIKTTVNELTRVLGEPSYTGDFSEDKVTVEWICERKNGDVITIYDWKEYRSIGKDEKIEFHLGGHSQLITFNGKEDLVELLNK